MTLGDGKGVPREPFQEAFKRSGMNATELAERMGYVRNHPRPGHRRVGDATRVLRILGLKDEKNEGVTRIRRGPLPYDLAVRLAKAMDVDPVDLGV